MRDRSSSSALIQGSWPSHCPPSSGQRRSAAVYPRTRTLTPREFGVLKLLRSDLSERDIGRELYVSHYTVHSHVRSIYRKLAVRSRADALERSRELGIL